MEWISVKDRLPSDENDYLIYTSEKLQYVAYWFKVWENKNYWKWVIRCECCNAEDDLLNEDNITHWMPLPPPPKD